MPAVQYMQNIESKGFIDGFDTFEDFLIMKQRDTPILTRIY